MVPGTDARRGVPALRQADRPVLCRRLDVRGLVHAAAQIAIPRLQRRESARRAARRRARRITLRAQQRPDSRAAADHGGGQSFHHGPGHRRHAALHPAAPGAGSGRPMPRCRPPSPSAFWRAACWCTATATRLPRGRVLLWALLLDGITFVPFYLPCHALAGAHRLVRAQRRHSRSSSSPAPR